jgi:hypothetical protein
MKKSFMKALLFVTPLYSQIIEPSVYITPLDTNDPAPSIELITSDSPCPGKFFISNIDRTAPTAKSHLLIIDNNGKVFESKVVSTAANNFQLQPTGHLTYYANAESQFYVLDSNFNTVRTIKAEQPYGTGFHELLLFKNGNYMIIGRQQRVADLSEFGGKQEATVTDCLLLEYDKNDNKVFEWNTKDHFKVTDATFEDITANTVNYCHINGIEIDNDDNILISSRNMDEITKINRSTGEVMWRFGGKNNQFTLIGDSIFFNHQHSVRALPNGNYILFDNGNFNTPAVSRACEYKIDTTLRTATLVWKYVHPVNMYSFATGSVQWLPSDNILIGWGADRRVTATEVDRQGNTKCEFRLSNNWETYRTYKFPWKETSSKVTSVASGNAVSIVPNPAISQAVVKIHLDEPSDIIMTVFDALGREFTQKSFESVGEGYSSLMLNTSTYPQGTYIVRVQYHNTIEFVRLIKQ